MESFENKIEDMRKKAESLDFLLNMLAESGNPKFILAKKHKDLMNRASDLMTTDKLLDNEELVEKLGNMFDQFANVLNDFAKENNLEMEDK